MKKRIITAILIVVIGLPLIILGGWFTVGLAYFICACSIVELLKTGKGRNWSIAVYVAVAFWSILMINWGFIIEIFTSSSELSFNALLEGFESRVNIMIVVGFLITLLTVECASKNFDINVAFYLFTMTVLITISLQNFIFIRLDDSLGLRGLIYVIATTFSCDMFAHVFGTKFGKHKLAPVISPNKSIEGAVAGVVGATLVGSLLFLVFPFELGFNSKLFNIIGIIIISIILGLGSVVGDLIFSSIKRQSHLKDFSNLLPGHGGMLDRVDSLLFNILVFTSIHYIIQFIV